MASDDRPTGKQCDYLLALGVKVRESVTRAQVSQLMDEAKSEGDAPPNDVQRAVAHDWGVDLSNAKNRWAACGSLMQFIIARRWVVSVCRRQAAARWRFYRDSGLPEHITTELAHWFLSQPGYLDAVEGMEVGETTTGDAWFRLTDRKCADFEPYLATAQRAFELLGATLARPKVDRSTAQPVKKKPTGCLVFVVVSVFVAVYSTFTLVKAMT